MLDLPPANCPPMADRALNERPYGKNTTNPNECYPCVPPRFSPTVPSRFWLWLRRYCSMSP